MSNSSRVVTCIRVTNAGQSRVAIVQRHIRENEQRVAAQRAMLEKFHNLGLPTAPVEALLAECEAALALYRQDLEAMLRERPPGAI